MSIDNPYKRIHSHPQIFKSIPRYGNYDNSSNNSYINDNSTGYQQKIKSQPISYRHLFYLVFMILVIFTFYLHTKSEVHVMKVEKMIKEEFKLRGSAYNSIKMDENEMKGSYNDFFSGDIKDGKVSNGQKMKYDDGLQANNNNKEKNFEQELTDEYDARGHIISNKNEKTSKLIKKNHEYILETMDEKDNEIPQASIKSLENSKIFVEHDKHDIVTLSPDIVLVSTPSSPIQSLPSPSIDILNETLIDSNTDNNKSDENIKPSSAVPLLSTDIDDTAKMLRDHDVNSKEIYNRRDNDKSNENSKPSSAVPLLSIDIDDTAKILRDHDLNNKEVYNKRDNDKTNANIKPSSAVPLLSIDLDDTAKILRDHDLNNKEIYNKRDDKGDNERIKIRNIDEKNSEKELRVEGNDKNLIVDIDKKEDSNVIERNFDQGEKVLEKGETTIIKERIQENNVDKDREGEKEIQRNFNEDANILEGAESIVIRGQIQEKNVEEGKEGEKEIERNFDKDTNILEGPESTIIRGQIQEKNVEKSREGEIEGEEKEMKAGDENKENKEGAESVVIRGQIQELYLEKIREGEKEGEGKEMKGVENKENNWKGRYQSDKNEEKIAFDNNENENIDRIKIGNNSNNPCANEDPFLAEPGAVETWVPPKNSDLLSKIKWKETVNEMLHNIKRLKIGGDELRIFIKNEVAKLNSLRLELFCRFL